MKAQIEVTPENARELIAFHLANPETKMLNSEGKSTDDFREYKHLQVQITIDQLNFKPRKKREGE